ncbi:MAG: mycothiol system anti-sigma-R factor [Actinomycetota bacterium]|jgi:mycothiol system anti-sigma-R factor|nr:mycothiol system anti-sigma-R factor [Actinomycetota bacterium]
MDDSSGRLVDADPDPYGTGCREALEVLYRYLDGELDDERRRIIAYHLERCSPCLVAFDFEAELKAVIAHRCRESVPESLRLRVASVLAEASEGFRPPA